MQGIIRTKQESSARLQGGKDATSREGWDLCPGVPYCLTLAGWVNLSRHSFSSLKIRDSCSSPTGWRERGAFLAHTRCFLRLPRVRPSPELTPALLMRQGCSYPCFHFCRGTGCFSSLLLLPNNSPVGDNVTPDCLCSGWASRVERKDTEWIGILLLWETEARFGPQGSPLLGHPLPQPCSFSSCLAIHW